LVNRRPVSDEIDEGNASRSAEIRRTMYRWKPLAELRALHRDIVDAWPTLLMKWAFYEDTLDEPSDLELSLNWR
jgi:hypothetical protein